MRKSEENNVFKFKVNIVHIVKDEKYSTTKTEKKNETEPRQMNKDYANEIAFEKKKKTNIIC